MRRAGVFLSLLVCIPVLAQAGPPMLTGDPGTPGDGNWEINIAATLEKRRSESRWEAPALDLNYGLGEHIQLSYEVPWIVLSPSGEGTRSGLGNSNIGVKWRFLDEEKHGISASIKPEFEFNPPTSSADRGVVEEGTVFRLPLQMEKKLGPVTAGLEFGRAFKRKQDDAWIYGFVAGHKATERLELLGEIHGTGRPNFRMHETVFNLGAIYDLGKNYSALLSVGRSFQSAASDAPTLLLYIGMQLRL